MSKQTIKKRRDEAKARRGAEGRPLQPPVKAGASRDGATPASAEPTLPLSPAGAKLKRFRQAVEKEASVGKVEWEEKGKPVGKCERCPVSARPHDVSLLFSDVPYLTYSHGPVEGGHIAQYNEWLRATWVELYYHDKSGRFWTREADPEKWVMLDQGAAVDMLARIGVSKEQYRQVLLDVRRHYNVRYAASLAGYKSGVYTMFGNIILVTDSPVIIQARYGEWPTLRKLFEGVWGEVQLPYLYGWLRSGYEGLASGKRRIGQALVLVGERDSGKSLTQKLITQILGGRVARPYSYMIGKTDFNYDLFGCEHLAIEDQKASTEWHTRRLFGTALKDIVTITDQRCHKKFADAITLTPLWRLSISLNNEPENLCVLPPMDPGMEDKVILLQSNKQPMPMATTTQAEIDLFWKTLVGELPAFLHYLTIEWEMPAHLLTGEGAGRFGMAHYHNPAVLQSINELENEFKLLQFLDMVLFSKGEKEPRNESAEWFEQQLRGSDFAREAAKLLTFPRACGAYLAKLADKYPDRVKKHRTSRRNTWILYPPLPEGGTQLPLGLQSGWPGQPMFLQPRGEEP